MEVVQAEQQLELELQAKGLTAPRVTPTDLDAAIAKVEYHRLPGTNVTVCMITLQNGFTTTGINHGSVDLRNYNEKLGQEMAYKQARNQLWPLLGYALKTQLKLVEEATPLGTDDPLYKMGEVKTYLGTKVVYGLPMTRKEYNDFRGWTVPANENPMDKGFLVQYADGGASNVEGFSGYISWSPEEVFHRAYSSFGSPEGKATTTYVDRMVEEYDQLKDRCEKLARFLSSGALPAMSRTDNSLLNDQYEYMTSYLNVLAKRLERAGK